MNSGIFQISHLKTPLEKLQEINKNTLGPLLPVEVISYVEALSYSPWNTMSDPVSDSEALQNTTINVSGSSLGVVGCVLIPKVACDSSQTHVLLTGFGQHGEQLFTKRQNYSLGSSACR